MNRMPITAMNRSWLSLSGQSASVLADMCTARWHSSTSYMYGAVAKKAKPMQCSRL